MSAPSPPPDHSLEIAQMEQQAAREERARQEAEAQRRRQELAQLRSNAFTGAGGRVRNYFTEQGVDPDQYSNTIDDMLQSILMGIPMDDPNPGGYFTNAGTNIYNQAETSYRNKQGRALDSIFAPNFADTRLPFTIDDSAIGDVLGEQRNSADEIIRNMLNRGVITQSGFEGATRAIDRQEPGVRSRLNTIGEGIIAGGRTRLSDVANRARSSASQLRLGGPFDPYSYGGQADREFEDFIRNLPNTLRGAAPGNLFDTTGLAAIAGAAQGGQNTKFNPSALAGIIEPEDEQPAPRKKQEAEAF